MTSRHTWSLLALLAASSIVRCGSAPATAPGTPPPPTAPLRTFAGPTEAEAALLELEDRRAFDASTLESAARSTEPAVRARAALALGRIGDPRGRALLAALLGDRDSAVQASAAFASQVMADPTMTSELIPLLSNHEVSVVRAAARAIGFLGRGDGQDALTAAVDTAASPEPRATILRALWRFAVPATEQAALRFVNDPETRVRFGAVYAISRKPLESSLPALTAALSDGDADIAAFAARALGILGKKESVGPLAETLDSGKPPLVTNALVALEAVLEKNPGTSAGKERVARVLSLAGDANANLAVPALTLLRQFAGADRDVFRRLWAIATTGTGYRRQVALSSASAVLRDNALPALQAAAGAPEAPLRAVAAEALGYLSFAKASALRSKLAADPSPLVRGALLTGLRTAEAVSQNRSLVEAAANDADPGVRAAAIDALTRLGNASVIPVLTEALAKSATVREPDVPLAVIAAAEKLRAEPGAQAVVEAAYRHPNPVVARIARRTLLQSFRVPAASFPQLEFRTPRTSADYLTLVTEARKPWTASVETARGTFRVRLAGAAAPITVINFVSLAQKGYFNGSTFHRVVPNFVIQDGDPTGTGNGGPGYEIRDELNPIEYSEGTVGMALSGPDTGGSQWFVTHAPQPHLDGIYTVFGQVAAGQDVVERIEQGDRITRVSVAEAPAP